MNIEKRRKRLLIAILVVVFIFGFTASASATNGGVDVIVIIHKQAGNQPFENVQVQLGQNTKYTDSSGSVGFRLENIPTTTMVPLSLADPNKPTGSHAKLNLKLDTATTDVIHKTGQNTYDIYIEYNNNTNSFTIFYGVTTNDEWEVGQIQFDQQNTYAPPSQTPAPPPDAPPGNPDPAPREPEPYEPEPQDPDIEHPPEEGVEQPPPDENFDPDMPHPDEQEIQSNGVFGLNIFTGNTLLYLIICVLAGVIVVFIIVFLVKKRKNKNKKDE